MSIHLASALWRGRSWVPQVRSDRLGVLSSRPWQGRLDREVLYACVRMGWQVVPGWPALHFTLCRQTVSEV